MNPRRTRPAQWAIASVALIGIACGGDDAARRAPDTPAAAIFDSALVPAPATPAGAFPAGDTARSGIDSVRRATTDVSPAPGQPTPRTAPGDRATARTPGAPSGVRPPATVAPESVVLDPHVVPAPVSASASATTDAPPARPFAVGEQLTYDVRFGRIRVGRATMEVVGIESVRGTPAYHTRFEVDGGNRLYRVRDRYESWFDTRSLSSLRYVQDIAQGSYERHSVFEIFPAEARFIEVGKDPQPSVAEPLDEGSFLYWMRTIPLEVGETYTFDRYFRPDRNPVRIHVVRRERIRVPAGEFDAIVVQPTIRTRGIFSEGGHAEIWFADDSTRRILQMKSRLAFGSLNLYLTSASGER